RLRYLKAGSGPPLILLHGLLGYSFSWRFVIPALAPHATVYAIDMLGAGFSDRCPGLDCSFRGCAERLLKFAQQMGLTSFDLMGTSHGGAVAMTAAAMSQDRTWPQVNRLILVDPVNPWSRHGRGLTKFLNGRIASILFRKLMPRATSVHGKVLRRLYGDVSKIRPGTLEGYSEPFALPGSFEYPLSIIKTWTEDLNALEAALPRIAHIPTLMIWGTLDRAVDPASAHTLCRYFHTCEVVEMEGVGHLPYEEAPEEFSEIVIRFLRSSVGRVNADR
ncbi:MAG TPA: alpha/beta hydrolase, partial [Terriglobales bacterium]|nr:alpha/beta hydrolase [Terriglobales bacterium]